MRYDFTPEPESKIELSEVIRRSDKCEYQRQYDTEDFMRHWTLETRRAYIAGGGCTYIRPTQNMMRVCVGRGREKLSRSNA